MEQITQTEAKSINLWLEALRLKTLPASLLPVFISASVAKSELNNTQTDSENFWTIITFCSLFSLLIQITTNLANEYFDYKKGADTQARLGPNRAVSQGLIKPETMLLVATSFAVASFFLGLELIRFGGWPMLFIGIVSISLAFAYTGGPFPIAYNGLGDVFVVLFFGFVAVCVPYYLIHQSISYNIIVWSIATGLVINNLLVVNNYRDVDEDTKSKKKTTTVLFGRKFALFQYGISYVISLLLIPLYFAMLQNNFKILTIAILIIPAFRNYQLLKQAVSKEDFLKVLKKTAKLMVMFGAIIILTQHLI